MHDGARPWVTRLQDRNIHSYLTLGLDVRPPSKQHRDFMAIASPAVIRPRVMPS